MPPSDTPILKNAPAARFLERTSQGDTAWAEQVCALGFGALTEVKPQTSWAVAAAGLNTTHGAGVALLLVNELLRSTRNDSGPYFDRGPFFAAVTREIRLCLGAAIDQGNVAFIVGLDSLFVAQSDEWRTAYVRTTTGSSRAAPLTYLQDLVVQTVVHRACDDPRMDKNPNLYAWVATLPWFDPSSFNDHRPERLGTKVVTQLSYNMFNNGSIDRTFALLNSLGIKPSIEHLDGAMKALRASEVQTWRWSKLNPELQNQRALMLGTLASVLTWTAQSSSVPDPLTVDGRDLLMELKTWTDGLCQRTADSGSWQGYAERLARSTLAWETAVLKAPLATTLLASRSRARL